MGIMDALMARQLQERSQVDRRLLIDYELQARAKATEAERLAAEAALKAQAPGLAKQLGRTFGTGNIQAATAVGLLSDPATQTVGAQFAQQMLAPQTTDQRLGMAQQQSQFEQQLALEKQRTLATVANMSMDNAAKISQLKIQANQAGFTNESNLRQDFNKNPLVLKSELALTSYEQLINALDQNDPTALGAAIVAITQVQEPGLAVREDDRVRYQGSNPLITQLAQMANNATVSGRIDPVIDQRMRALGTRLAAPHAANYARVKSQYGQLALQTPGSTPERVTTGTGIDEGLVSFLISVNGGQ